MDMPSIVSSELSQSVLVEGRRFQIDFYRAEDEDFWTLEVINDEGTSFIWGDPFATEQAALDAALTVFEKEGAAGFN